MAVMQVIVPVPLEYLQTVSLLSIRRHYSFLTRKYLLFSLSDKTTGGQATQSPATQRTDVQNPIQTDSVDAEESDSEMAETQFTIPEKNGKDVSDKPDEKQNEPEYMTYRL